MLAWLRGERQWYDEAEKRHRRVQLIDFENTGRERLSRHVGVDAEAARPQGQPRGRDVRRQRRAGLHRRAQEPEGRRRHRARHQAAPPLRDRDAGADRRAAALQRHAPARLLVRRHLERQPPLHGALEADARGDLSLRGAGVLRARPTSCARSSTGFCSTSRTARRGSRCCASTSAAPSTRSSRAAPTRPRRAASSGTRRARARPSPCSPPRG